MVPLLSQAQTQPGTSAPKKEGVKIKILRTDTTIILQSSQQNVTKLIGNVKLYQDSVLMTCDSAILINEQQLFAYDSVTIQQGDSLTTFANYLEYDGRTRKAYLEGEVVLINGSRQLFTDRLDYDLNTKIASYYYGATLVADSTQLSSKRGYYYVDEEEAAFKDSVVVTDPDFYLRTDTLQYSLELSTVYFLAPTLITADSSDIYCEDGFYDTENGLAEFRQNAQYQKNGRRATAEVIRFVDAQDLYVLEGKAQVVDSSRLAIADTIRYFEATDESYLTGNASYRDATRNIQDADEIYYNADRGTYTTRGRSKIQEEEQVLEADDVAFDESSGQGLATGTVIWQDTSANISIRTDTARYRQDTEYLKAVGGPEGRPELISIFEDGDSLFLASDTLFSRNLDTTGVDSSRTLSAYRDARFYKSDFQGVCDSMVYTSADSLFRLFGNPLLWSDSTQFKADTMRIQLANGEIDRVYLMANAIIINQTHPQFFNQIKGKKITAYFKAGELDYLVVEGNAESVYYAKDETGAYIGVDQSISSKLLIRFREGEISEIRSYKDPQSTLSPMDEVDHASLRLKGFDWRIDRRPTRRMDIFARRNR
ncbi:MAG TPA: OstA-like protein [Saprospiraceae bacterium]|nr:OstA-like protein [Saprospiraceae bacterium]